LGFVQLYPSFSSAAARRIWILNDLFVAPAARRRGIGRALLQAARDHGVATGAKRLVLSTAASNREARAVRIIRVQAGRRVCDVQARALNRSVDGYNLNGYGVEGLIRACRLQAGLEPS